MTGVVQDTELGLAVGWREAPTREGIAQSSSKADLKMTSKGDKRSRNWLGLLQVLDQRRKTSELCANIHISGRCPTIVGSKTGHFENGPLVESLQQVTRRKRAFQL
jgi:hypothetical protein